MATTSLWHIKGRLKDLIDYVENPEKTASKMPELQDLYNVFSYLRSSSAPIWTRNICTVTSASTPCLSGTAASTTIPK